MEFEGRLDLFRACGESLCGNEPVGMSLTVCDNTAAASIRGVVVGASVGAFVDVRLEEVLSVRKGKEDSAF